ncbi:MAG: type II toxin-antitoxin system RelE/ParE family toxin [Cyclobacteriaceae bacterium]|nr:type II toxin-antitoxin system RelE/ParE family toxin [Cyclobacteriaceae bacterium]
MAQRKIAVLDKASEEVAYVGYYLESAGVPATAKRFINEAFDFFEKLADARIIHKPCSYYVWQAAGYRCAIFKKKYVVAYLSSEDEILICDFALQKLLYKS